MEVKTLLTKTATPKIKAHLHKYQIRLSNLRFEIKLYWIPSLLCIEYHIFYHLLLPSQDSKISAGWSTKYFCLFFTFWLFTQTKGLSLDYVTHYMLWFILPFFLRISPMIFIKKLYRYSLSPKHSLANYHWFLFIENIILCG